MHAVGVAERHRTARVAVVATLERKKFALFRESARVLILHGHLRGNLHRDGTGVGEEHAIQPRRHERGQRLSQFDGRRMGEAAEHHVGKRLALAADRLDDGGMVVPVGNTPPTRNGIRKRTPIRQRQLGTARRLHKTHRRRIAQRGIRMPDMTTIIFKKCIHISLASYQASLHITQLNGAPSFIVSDQ